MSSLFMGHASLVPLQLIATTKISLVNLLTVFLQNKSKHVYQSLKFNCKERTSYNYDYTLNFLEIIIT